jgi:hypothetical protein
MSFAQPVHGVFGFADGASTTDLGVSQVLFFSIHFFLPSGLVSDTTFPLGNIPSSNAGHFTRACLRFCDRENKPNDCNHFHCHVALARLDNHRVGLT